MKYLVISCIDREISLDAACDTYEEAYAELKDRFIDYQRDCGYSEEELSILETRLDNREDFEFHDCGLITDGFACVWSNTGRDPYDIKIVEQY